MRLKRLMDKFVMRITEPEKSKELIKWQERLEVARKSYESELDLMKENEKLYSGSREVKGNPNKPQPATKVSSQVRNITYELIESQVDSSIPMPKVTPIHAEDLKLARSIEHWLSNFVREHKFYILNDSQERNTPVLGGDFMMVEWDSTKGYHCTLGDVEVSGIHPRQVIPQPGCIDIEKMDYIFVKIAQTKEFVKKKYGVDVENAGEESPEIRNNDEAAVVNDIVTVNMAFYRNKKGGIGRFVWCQDYVLDDKEDYQARKQEVCAECGLPKTGEVCQCGSKKFKETDLDFETIEIPIKEMVNGSEVVKVAKGVQIPYYKPNKIPLILRKNVSRDGKMLGYSDAYVIRDQQNLMNKLGTIANDKVLTAGSFFTIPKGKKIKLTDEQFKVVELDSPDQKAMIGTFDAHLDPTIDRLMMADQYDAARSTLGITDAFQGKYDPSAVSGTAKQYSINQAAGRLESKRVLKNDAYAHLYEMIFQFMLAYSDQKVPFSYQNEDGEYEFEHFDRYDFLRQDAAGEWYWNDEFIFETDPTSTMLMNREAMWQQADLKLQSGAFGMLGDPEAMYKYWRFQEMNNYPNASEMKKMFEQKVQEQKLTPEGFAPPNANSALIPDDYVQTDVEKALSDAPMTEQSEYDPYLAQALVGSAGSEVL